MRTPSYVVGIVQSGKGLSFAAKRHGACAVVAGVEVFVAGLCTRYTTRRGGLVGHVSKGCAEGGVDVYATGRFPICRISTSKSPPVRFPVSRT